MGAEAVANQRCQPASGPARMGAEAGSHRDGDAAIRALGPLFRITDVFLWDNASSGISKSSTCHDSSPQEYSADYVNSAVSCSNVDSVVDDATSEDLELARQMDALGLPTSFKTNKEDDVISVFNDLHSLHHVMNDNRNKKAKRITSNQKMLSGEDKGHDLPEMVERLPSFLIKYWYQRYSLFSKFDHGVKVDEEGWFSVTPEAIARHHASRCGHGIVVDCFTGVGGNAIQFAKKSNHVIAIDIDPQKVDCARHNATIYGVGSNIDFIKGDFFILASQLKADTLFMSPPWGGPDYAKVQVYDISMLKPRDGYFLFKMAMKIASSVVMFLPRNVDPNQLAELSLLASPPWELEAWSVAVLAVEALFTRAAVN